MEWFILNKDEHLGPFSEDSIKSFFQEKKIGEDQLIWKEGWDEPQTFVEVFSSKASSDLPPDLPPLPPEAFIDSKPVESRPKPNEKTTKVSKPVQTVEVKTNPKPLKVKNQEIRENEESLELNISDDPVEHSEEVSGGKKAKKYAIIFSSVIIIMMIGLGIWIYFEANKRFHRPSLMALKDYNRLLNASKEPLGKSNFEFALSKDKKSLWLSTNIPLEGSVILSLKGIQGKTLGEVVELSALGELSNFLIDLKRLKFKQGSRLVDGVYEVQISSNQILELPWFQRFFYDGPREITWTEKRLISTFGVKEFKKQLARLNKAKKNNTKDFWLEIGEKYKTVMMITGQIRGGVESIFSQEEADWKSKVLNFENKYKTTWGQFFTEFVKANDKSYAKYVNKNFEDQAKVLEYYNNLSNLAIQIGEESMRVLEGFQEQDFSKVTGSEKDEKVLEATSGFMNIEKQCEEKIKEIKSL